MRQQRQPAKSKKDLRGFFERLQKKGVTLERVAVDLNRSYSTIANLKYGRAKADTVTLMALEHLYRIKVA